MQCPNCQFDNPEEMQFCGKCGTALRDDSSKDRLSLLHNYIPSELKRKIIQAGKQLESERRLVTVVFSDVCGFTGLSEKLDPEIVTHILNDFFRGLISIIHKYEGMIIDFFGDGILSIFGAPLAHENDPERAIRCSQEMMSYTKRLNNLNPHQLPSPLGLHIGINTGLVITGNVGSDLRMRYSAVGTTVNLCSRIADLAPEGEIYLSEDTYKLVSELVHADGPNSLEVKGKEEPIQIYKFNSLKNSVGKKDSIQINTLVGRKNERGIIAKAIKRVMEKKEVRLFVRGEAGVGKTRLKEDFYQTAFLNGMVIFEGQCSSFETNTPYFLWNTLLKSMLNIEKEATETSIKNQLHDTLDILHLENEEPYLATLLSLRYEEILLEEDKERKRRIFESVNKLLVAYANRKPTVFILEDLHWIDRFSQELLEFLFKNENLAPSLFFIIYRTEYADAQSIIHRGTLINLDRLSDDNAVLLMKLRLNVEIIPERIKELINQRTEGNPFFIEEIIKTLLDREIISFRRGKIQILKEDIEAGVPETIQGVIMSRIDSLEEMIREVLLNASVVGREFSRPVLEKVIKKREEVLPSLRHLKGLELILEKEEAQELEYLFKHYLIQEVAYNTILVKKRKELHGLIARAIEEIYSTRLKDLYELLAFHYEQAEEWGKAAEYYGRAGRKNREIYTEDESKDFFNRKDLVIEKLFESTPAKGLLAKLIGVLFSLIVAYLLAAIFITLSLKEVKIEWLFLDLSIDPELWIHISLLIKYAFSILLTWAILLAVFTIVIPIFRRIKFFDLMKDKIEIVKDSEKFFSITFSEIKYVHFRSREKGSPGAWIFTELHRDNPKEENKKMTFRIWMGKQWIVPYSIGIAKDESRHILISREKGINWLFLLFPWLHTPEKCKYITVCPSDPKEFFEQLKVAYKKWQREKTFALRNNLGDVVDPS